MRFAGDNGPGAAGPRHGDREQADRTAARHRHAPPGDLSGEHRVHGVPERVEHRGVFHRDRRINLPDVRFGDFDEFREAAVGVYADNAHVLADVPLAGAALKTAAAGQVHLRRDEIPGPDAFHLRSHPLHGAAEFVAENQRQVNPPRRPAVPFINVEVCAADGRRAHPNQNVAQADFRNLHFLEAGSGLGLRLDDGLHGGDRHEGSGRLKDKG